jgi:hypothetical protein
MMSKVLNELCQEIIATTALLNVICEISPGLSKDKLKDREEEYSITLSPVVKTFYSEIDSFKLAWEFHNEELSKSNTFIEGHAKILNFHKMFMGFDGGFWRGELWFENTPKRDLQFLKRLKVLDYYGKDSVQCVCLEITDDHVLSPNLWLFYEGLKPMRMEFDLTEYASKLRQTKAIWGWQFFYVDVNLSEPKFEAVKENCEMVIQWYGKIFSDGFESELADRYHKRLKH